MARTETNTQNDTKTRTTSWRNRHLEKNIDRNMYRNEWMTYYLKNAYLDILGVCFNIVLDHWIIT